MDGVLSAKNAFKRRKARSEWGQSTYLEWEKKAILNIERAKYIIGRRSLSRLDDLGCSAKSGAYMVSLLTYIFWGLFIFASAAHIYSKNKTATFGQSYAFRDFLFYILRYENI
jgi:hypothetical protein